MKSDVDLYLSSDRQTVVLEGDPAAAFLLVNAGRDIPDAEVEGMGSGLLAQARRLGSKSVGPVEDKEVKGPAENKGPDDGLEQQTRAELEALAAERDVDVSGAKTKADVLEALRAAASAPEATEEE